MPIVVGALVMLAPPAALLAGYIFRCSSGSDALMDSSSSSSPASQEAIEALDDVTGDDDDDGGGGECAICLDQPVARSWKEMPCGHRFHGGCVAKWLRVRATCPVCRHQMPPAPAAIRIA